MTEKIIINITVRNKVANVEKGTRIVCSNTNYKAVFDFDDEWNDFAVKTAYFAVNGDLIPVVFNGNECDIPYIENTTLIGVGVGSGDINDGNGHEVVTTLPAYIEGVLSIKDLGGVIAPPSVDAYSQIIALINAGMLKGEKGDKGDKGEKGDAGAIKFITAVSLPTENIDDSAIYLVPMADGTDENRFAEYAYIDGKWETLGAVTLNVDHSEYVKFTDYATDSKAGVVRVADNGGYGIYIYPNTGIVRTWRATNFEIDAKTDHYKPLVPAFLDYAVKVGLTTNTETLTDDEKATACEWLGAVGKQANATGNYRTYVARPQNGGNTTLDTSYTPNTGAIPIMGAAATTGKSAANSTLPVCKPEHPYAAANKIYVDDNAYVPTRLVLKENNLPYASVYFNVKKSVFDSVEASEYFISKGITELMKALPCATTESGISLALVYYDENENVFKVGSAPNSLDNCEVETWTIL